jgi:hypothetical protein
MRILISGVAGAALALVAAACGSPATTTSAPAATPTSSATTSGPTGPPTAGVTFTGDVSLAGGMTIGTIECSLPSLDGDEIVVNGTSAITPSISIRLTVSASSVVLLLDTGSGSSFHARDFSGTGVTGFDAASGVKFSGPVSETTPANASPSLIGSLKSIDGSVDCAGQTPGTSTLAISGTVPQGVAAGSMTSVHVVCFAANTEVETFGLINVGGTPAYAVVFAFSGRFTMDLLPSSGAGEFFTSNVSASVTTSSTAATISGDATESVAAGATASTLHVSGQSTCGSAITP